MVFPSQTQFLLQKRSKNNVHAIPHVLLFYDDTSTHTLPNRLIVQW